MPGNIGHRKNVPNGGQTAQRHDQAKKSVRASKSRPGGIMANSATARWISAAFVLAGSQTLPALAQDARTAPPPPPAPSAASGEIEEVVVTARKRAEKIEEVPAAVTAFTAQEIEDAGITNTRDFIAATPNVELVETQQVGTAFVIIRGIEQARNSEPSVATVVDGVNQTFAAAISQDLYDIRLDPGPEGAAGRALRPECHRRRRHHQYRPADRPVRRQAARRVR